MDKSIAISLILMFIVLAAAGIVFILMRRKKDKKEDVPETPAETPSVQQVFEPYSYADAGGVYALQNASIGASCGCSSRLCSDLSNCCANRYPIDLPYPESGVIPPCSDCTETLKYVLQ